MNDFWLGLQSPWLAALPPVLILAVRSKQIKRQWDAAVFLFTVSFWIATVQVIVQSLRSHTMRIDVEQVLLLLILFLAIVILRFSQAYLRGEATQARYIRLLSTTALSSALVVTAPRLDILLLAWVAGSVSMNGLLQHYPERRAAQLAAHKKFIVSRLAELCLLGACVLVHHACGTLSITDLHAYVANMQTLPVSLRLAMVLMVITVLLKTAQVPLHGWLMQVMEAPTPVSALLHAGVVNLGGIFLLRVPGLLDRCPTAQWILVCSGGATLLLSGLVAMTRVSIKVRLAWSTCAQMGFLLVECGLGLYSLALLHLVGHSLYKAHAFLTSGNTVQEYRAQVHRQPPVRSPGQVVWITGFVAVLSSLFVWSTYHVLAVHVPVAGYDLASVMIVGIGLAPLLHRGLGLRAGIWAGPVRYLTLLTLYLCWHAVFSSVIRDPQDRSPWLVGMFAAQFLLLYFLQAIAQQCPQFAWLRSLRHLAFHGFHLDESFTRAVVAQWPARFRKHEDSLTPTSGLAKEYA